MARAVLIWSLLVAAIVVPVAVATTSPLLAWREPIYIVAGFAGVVALALMLVQPLLAGGYLPGLDGLQGRQTHRWTGIALILAVAVHVCGLWITSPPDVIDALTFTSPTPFSAWGVIAMWAVFAAGMFALFRRRVRLRTWRRGHTALAAIAVVGGVVHAILIEGTMGTWSKAALCALVLVVTAKAFADLRVWAGKARHGKRA